MQQRLDEGAAHDVRIGVAAQAVLQLRAGARSLAEQDRPAHGGGPQAVVAAEERGERLAELLRLERPVLEERELPAVERLAELGIVVRAAELA